MIIFKQVTQLQQHLQKIKLANATIGFVPTMGALHAGHLSLINTAHINNSLTVCSIFVNPTQFNDPVDFKKYPVTIEEDIYKLEKARADILFLPEIEEIYPNGSQATYRYELGELATILEGKYRPEHFKGVCQVVHRLLNIVRPNALYVGQKDYQQCLVLQKLIELLQLNINLIISPTQREADGLAMSSRNMRLAPEQRKAAVAIINSLSFIKENLKTLPIEYVKQEAAQMILQAGFAKVDYIEICEANNLQSIQHLPYNKPLIALTAAFLGEVRLIDNLFLDN